MNPLTVARLNAGLSVSDACEILGRSLRTWQHWKKNGAPTWALRVLAIYAGDLGPLGWTGWRLVGGQLYAPGLKYGWEREHLYAAHWDRQRLAFLLRQQKETRRASQVGTANAAPLVPISPAYGCQEGLQAGDVGADRRLPDR